MVLLDAAKLSESLATARAMNPAHACLYYERGEPLLADVAPYLFAISNADDFGDWFYTNGWGNAWGTIVKSKIDFDYCVDHFRKFLIIKTESNQQLYFRFYDPRVLKIFLPTCDQQQIIEFFGPIEKFIVEGHTKEEAIEFTHQNGNLLQKVIPATAVFNLQPATLPNH